MRIIGIDPGYAIIGFGVLDYENGRFSTLGFGAVTTPSQMAFEDRLAVIFRDTCELMEKYHPDYMAIEKLYFNTNTTTAIDVAQARGVILLAAVKYSVRIREYTPLQVKSAITGYGRAEKAQMMEMVRKMLRLPGVPKPDDTADALAMAICHAFYSGAPSIDRK